MGDVGVASRADVNSQHWNAAKYAFAEGRGEIGLTFSPWITNLIPNVWYLYFAGYYKISDKNILSGSFRYFSLGNIVFTSTGIPHVQFQPREFSLDAGYSRRFTNHLSGALVLRYIHSDLITGASAPLMDAKIGKSLAADLGMYYQKDVQFKDKEADSHMNLMRTMHALFIWI
jgi:hypothetical protein